MAQYATASELASHLQKDLDTASANQALTLATGEFVRRARRRWASTAGSWTTPATHATSLVLPYRDVTSIAAVRINGVVAAVDYTLRNGRVYRPTGFGDPFASPPDEITVEFMYGRPAAPDDARLAVLVLAGGLYENPGGIVSETIDDYSVRYGGGATSPSIDWREVADYYRGLLVA